MTSLMESARKYFEVTNKLSISNLINLFNPNPNLITGARDFSGNWLSISNYQEDGTYKGLKVLKTTTAWGAPYQAISCKKGKTYTFSFYAKEENNVDNTEATAYLLPAGDNSYDALTLASGHSGNSILLQSNWERYAFTFTMNKDYVLYPRIESNNTTGKAITYICGYKLEEGSLATPLTEVGGDSAGGATQSASSATQPTQPVASSTDSSNNA